jgi:signal transduction histidine kinase
MPEDEIHFCARGGCGWMRWSSEDAAGRRTVAELVVEDDGRGISAEDRARLFEPFFSTKGTRGTGLGLSVSWGLVEEHGGWIEVESAPGKGSRFTVRLPLPRTREG